MGWRTAKAQMAAGTYDAPGDQAGAGFAQGFASAFVPALTAAAQGYAADKREMRLTEHKEALLRQREAIGAARSANTSSQKVAEDIATATAFLQSNGIPVNAENIQGAITLADLNGGDGAARWSKTSTWYEANGDTVTWATGVEGGAPQEVQETLVPADTAVTYPDAQPSAETAPVANTAPVSTPVTTPSTTDSLEDTEETSGLMQPVAEPTPAAAVATGGEGQDNLELTDIQFVAYTGPVAESDPTATPVASGTSSTGFGFRPRTAVATGFKDAEVDISSITDYTKWVAASQELQIKNATLTVEQQEEWNAYGLKLWEIDNSPDLDYSNIDTTADITKWEENYRAKLDVPADVPLPVNIQEALNNIRTAVEAEEQGNMQPDQLALNMYIKTPEFEALSNSDQASFVLNFDLISKPNYTTREEAALALNLATQIGDDANAQRIQGQLERLSQQTDGRMVKTGYGEETVDGVRVIKPVTYYEKDGVIYDASTNKPYVGNLREALEETSRETWTTQTAGIRDYNKSVASYISLATTMQDIIDVASVDAAALTTVAGLLRELDTVKTEVQTFAGLISGYQGDTLTLDTLERQARSNGILGPNETLESISSNDNLQRLVAEVDGPNRAEAVVALRRALDAKFAIAQFRVGAAEGQSSTAMSNTDREEFRRFLSGFKNADDLAINYGSYLQNRLIELESIGMQYGPESATAQQFFEVNGVYPTAGAFTVEEQFKRHPQSDRLMPIWDSIQNGRLVESENNPYRPTTEQSQTEAQPTTQAMRSLPANLDTMTTADIREYFTVDGALDFTGLSAADVVKVQEAYRQAMGQGAN